MLEKSAPTALENPNTHTNPSRDEEHQSTSPPALSIMASMVSILAFSSGYSFSLCSKLGWLSTKGFSLFKNVQPWMLLEVD